MIPVNPMDLVTPAQPSEAFLTFCARCRCGLCKAILAMAPPPPEPAPIEALEQELQNLKALA